MGLVGKARDMRSRFFSARYPGPVVRGFRPDTKCFSGQCIVKYNSRVRWFRPFIFLKGFMVLNAFFVGAIHSWAWALRFSTHLYNKRFWTLRFTAMFQNSWFWTGDSSNRSWSASWGSFSPTDTSSISLGLFRRNPHFQPSPYMGRRYVYLWSKVPTWIVRPVYFWETPCYINPGSL